MKKPLILFRGISIEMFKKNEGIFHPKSPGREFASEICAGDPHAVAGSGVMAGKSSANEAIFHQWQQKGYPTSGHSTTPNFERAKHYATHSGTIPGLVFSFDMQLLKKHRVSILRVSDYTTVPAIPEDDEHILVTEEFGPLSYLYIVDIQRV